jgi:hypothetical protein
VMWLLLIEASRSWELELNMATKPVSDRLSA